MAPRAQAALVVTWLVGVTNVAGWAAFHPALEGRWYFPLVAAAGVLPMAPFALLRAHRDDEGNTAYVPKSGDFALGFACACALYGVLYAATRAMPIGTRGGGWMISLYAQWGDPSALRSRVVQIAFMTLACVYADELVWRDYVRRLLEPVVGSRRAFVLGVVLYAAAHLGAGWGSGHGAGFNPVLPAASLLLATAWTVLARSTGRIAPGWFCHALLVLGAILFFRLYPV